MKLNCDLGESYGAWKMPVDDAIMPLIDQANIACGFHGGDPLAMQHAVSLAKKHHVSIGAHPSYPDLQGFGRRSLAMKPHELIACLHYQIGALEGIACAQGATVDYVKPHGALYNDMVSNETVRMAVMDAVATYAKGRLPLMMLAHPLSSQFQQEAHTRGIRLLFEAFVDRRYTPEGALTPRQEQGAVLGEEEAISQALGIIDKGSVITSEGSRLVVNAQTLCVHGDSAGAVQMAKALRKALDSRGLRHGGETR